MEQKKSNFKKFIPLLPTSIFIVLIWMVYLINLEFNLNLNDFGMRPRTIKGLIGIVSMPFLHADLEHLWSNTLPMMVLPFLLFHFYNEMAWQVLFWLIFMTGLWVWIAARPANHIGASGLVYALVSFLIFSGFMRGNRKLIAISLIVVFLYGSLFWGIFPIEPHISWEGHLFGAIAGLMAAYAFRKEGIQKEKHVFDESEPDFDWGEGLEPETYFDESARQIPEKPFRFVYFFRKKKED